jgi:pimeloyl-ACP methyl ester carboxylesterase
MASPACDHCHLTVAICQLFQASNAACMAGAADVRAQLAVAVGLSSRTGGTVTSTDLNHYAAINGLAIHYTIHGVGSPLVLLHGGVGGSEMFDALIPTLGANRRVITIDLQAHGETADLDRTLRFDAMANDVAALLKHLTIEQTDILGYSLGGGVALRTAIQHPGLIRKLVVIAAPCKRDGWYPEVRANMANMGAEAAKTMSQSPLYQRYPNRDWATLFTKLGELLRLEYDWSTEIASMRAQALLIFADADAIRPAHMLEFFGALGGGHRDAGIDGAARPYAQLAILPGATHYDVLSCPHLVPVVTTFLNAPLPAAK